MRVQHCIGRQAGWPGIRPLNRFLTERVVRQAYRCVYIYIVVFTVGGGLITFVHYNSAKRNTNEHINIEKDIDRHGLGGSTLSLLQK